MERAEVWGAGRVLHGVVRLREYLEHLRPACSVREPGFRKAMAKGTFKLHMPSSSVCGSSTGGHPMPGAKLRALEG